MKTRGWETAATHLAAGLLGYVAARIIGDIRSYSFDHTIDPLALIALLLTVLLSVVFYRRLERLKYSDQLKKDAVIARLKVSVDNLFTLEEKCSSGELLYTDIVKALRKCRREFESYASYAKALTCPVGENSASQYRLVCSELKDLLTNTPPGSEAHASIRIIDGRIELDGDRLVEVEQHIDVGKGILFDIEKKIILDMA